MHFQLTDDMNDKEFSFGNIYSRMEDYLVLGRVGEGAHGIVMKCRHKISGQVDEDFQLDPSFESGGGTKKSSPQETGGWDQ